MSNGMLVTATAISLVAVITALSCSDDHYDGGSTTTSTSSGSGGSGTGGAGLGGINWGGFGGATSSGEGAGGGVGGTGEECPTLTLTEPIECTTYCQLMDGACKNFQGDFNDQYPGGYPDLCPEACAHFAYGSPGDTTGNSLACRIVEACLAQYDPNTHCTRAGPGGDGVCGDNCESFCALNLTVCEGSNQQWSTQALCLADCALFDFADPYNTSSDNWSGTDSAFACRMYWLMRALDDPLGSCPNTRPGGVSSDPCIDGV
ncbi:MAG: hypothetical protein DRI90_05285 [Deltaproteobacteria bacterium]|nr:MAG: hypothetical protein DRI90_05285 [Deltaproteobacteria bacterium]